MKAIAEVERLYQQWSTYFFWCLDAPYSALVCKPFWSWVAILSASIGVIGILWFAWKVIDYRLKYRAAMRAQWEREQVADYDVMEASRWTGENVVIDNTAESDMAGQIREALAKRKLGLDKPSLDLPSIDFALDVVEKPNRSVG